MPAEAGEISYLTSYQRLVITIVRASSSSNEINSRTTSRNQLFGLNLNGPRKGIKPNSARLFTAHEQARKRLQDLQKMNPVERREIHTSLSVKKDTQSFLLSISLTSRIDPDVQKRDQKGACGEKEIKKRSKLKKALSKKIGIKGINRFTTMPNGKLKR